VSGIALENPEEKVTKAIQDYVIAKYPDWAGLKIQVGYKSADRIFEELRGLEGEAGFKILEVYADFKPVGNVILPIEVSAGETRKKIFVRAKIEVFKNIVVAARQIKRAEIISADDLALEERDITMLPHQYYEDVRLVANTEAKTTIPKNSTIFEWMVKEIPLVKRGDEVAIFVSSPDLLVKTKGVALEDGYRGQEIKVKRENSKKTLEGVLVAPGEVEVNLE
jgi:flagella basal body P-ring formation protein FlgA